MTIRDLDALPLDSGEVNEHVKVLVEALERTWTSHGDTQAAPDGRTCSTHGAPPGQAARPARRSPRPRHQSPADSRDISDETQTHEEPLQRMITVKRLRCGAGTAEFHYKCVPAPS